MTKYIVINHIPGCQNIIKLNFLIRVEVKTWDVPHPIAAIAPSGLDAFNKSFEEIISLKFCQLWWIINACSELPLKYQHKIKVIAVGNNENIGNKNDFNKFLPWLLS